ncbi:MAG TPA: hypothetical protein VNH19_16560, partial [Candidatus Limnocylindrales bacterium]|nr:hypothetical protein [Candidatus Limnocylindrales bacterium]
TPSAPPILIRIIPPAFVAAAFGGWRFFLLITFQSGPLTIHSTASTITDDNLTNGETVKLVAVGDSSYLYDGAANILSDLCIGLFTLQIATLSSQLGPTPLSLRG